MTASLDEHNCVSLLLLFCGVFHICGMEIYENHVFLEFSVEIISAAERFLCLFSFCHPLATFSNLIIASYFHYTSSISLHEIPCDFLYFSVITIFSTCFAYYMILREETMFYCSPIFHAKHIMSTGTLTLFVFCLYPCFVSVVQIFPHKSQREGLSVHVNFCVGSLLYSRFIITIVTFYCRIGKLLCQLISVLSPICPIKHIITYLTPGCLGGSVAGHTQNL